MNETPGLKLSVAGKGGAGKTTIAAGLALGLARAGRQVFAVDGDSNNCLGYALGFPPDELADLLPLAEMREELESRAEPGGTGMYLLSPPVADLIDKYSLTRDSLRLLVVGTIGEAGGGCACSLNSALRQILRDMVSRPEAVVVDMEAGVEHLGRGTAGALDTMLVVAEPTAAGLRTARRIAELAEGLGVRRVLAVANKVRSDDELRRIEHELEGLPVAGAVPYLERMPDVLADSSPEAERILAALDQALGAIAQDE